MTRHQSFFALTLALAGTAGFAQAPGGLQLLASCDDTTDVKATIRTTDAVQVHSSLAGSGQQCYSVTASVDGQELRGYVLGAGHPAIVEYERVRARQPVIMPYIPPPPAPQPVSLAGFRGVDLNGQSVDLDRMKANTVIVYFWSPNNRRLSKDSEMLDYIHEQYEHSGVQIVGVASGATASAVKQFCDQNEAIWPQVLDSGRLAQQYHVDPAKPYLVLDQQRNVVASVSSATQIDTVLQKRLKGTL